MDSTPPPNFPDPLAPDDDDPTALVDLQHQLWGCVGGCALLVLCGLALLGYLVWHFLSSLS
jgi:hypothetical protein